MSWISDTLLKLTKQLYPTGRAFWIPKNGVFQKLHQGLAVSEATAYNAAVSTLNVIIPDNASFTDADASYWEGNLGIYSETGSTLDERKAAILQKMAYPGSTAPRCAASYIQASLRLAGFDVYVYENRFPDGSGGWITKSPDEILGITAGEAAYDDFGYGEAGYGDTWGIDDITVIANHLEPLKDEDFDIGDNWRSTFFIAGSTITTFASIPTVRQTTFRQLVLQLKPANTVGFTFIHFT